jgi:hypothetical protein
LLFAPVREDANYIVGAGPDVQVAFGCRR